MKNHVHLATNLGRGGISLLTLTGNEEKLSEADHAVKRLNKRRESIKTGELVFGLIYDRTGKTIIDEVVVSAPHKHCRIISGHGGSASTIALLEFYRDMGFTESEESAQPEQQGSADECTLRKLLPHARTETQAYHCLKALNHLRNGEPADIDMVISLFRPRIIVLAGAPNAGKSSLLNTICGYERVMVSDLAGTTRDAVRDYVNISGYYCHIIDTAGFRKGASESEEEAIKRGRQILSSADITLLILDSSRNLSEDDHMAIAEVSSHSTSIILPVFNKSDLPAMLDKAELSLGENIGEPVNLSCKTRDGLDELIRQITQKLM